MQNANPNEKKNRKFRISPAVALWFMASIFGELFSGSAPLNEYLNPFMIILFGMLYGSGALLIREFVIRLKKGWISMLLLGMAYGIYEEGLMVRSFFNPDWVDLGVLGEYGRVLGVNWVWAEHLTIYHAVISVMASIFFVEMLYPQQREESWINQRKMIIHAVLFLLTLPIGYLLMPYDAPIVGWLACWLLIGILIFLATFAPPSLAEKKQRKVPRPFRFWFTACVGTFLYFIFVYQAIEDRSMYFVVDMAIQLVYCLFILWLILRWSGNTHQWDDRHRMALISGALSFFLIFGPLSTNGQYPVMYFSNPVFLLLLWLAYRKVNKRVMGEME
jgi:lipid-A-disaccharide synthase-like uncharacterized protein